MENELQAACQTTMLAVCLVETGVDESRWAPRSSKPLAGRVAGRDGFDSHALPPDDQNWEFTLSFDFYKAQEFSGQRNAKYATLPLIEMLYRFP